jgi:hypothetical protein
MVSSTLQYRAAAGLQSGLPELAEASRTMTFVQLFEEKQHAGASTLTLGVLPMQPERTRLIAAGLDPGPIEKTHDFFIMRMRDPDGNLIVFASAEKS